MTMGTAGSLNFMSKKIQPVTNEELPHVQKARGYGIIEDIGGVGALEQYYDDYQKRAS